MNPSEFFEKWHPTAILKRKPDSVVKGPTFTTLNKLQIGFVHESEIISSIPLHGPPQRHAIRLHDFWLIYASDLTFSVPAYCGRQKLRRNVPAWRVTHRPNFGPVWFLAWPPGGQNWKQKVIWLLVFFIWPTYQGLICLKFNINYEIGMFRNRWALVCMYPNDFWGFLLIHPLTMSPSTVWCKRAPTSATGTWYAMLVPVCASSILTNCTWFLMHINSPCQELASFPVSFRPCLFGISLIFAVCPVLTYSLCSLLQALVDSVWVHVDFNGLSNFKAKGQGHGEIDLRYLD
jgi:hypothetical protein